MSNQSSPLKKKNSIFQKIKDFFDDIPDQQTIIINEASIKKPPQLKKSHSVETKQWIVEDNFYPKSQIQLIDELHAFGELND